MTFFIDAIFDKINNYFVTGYVCLLATWQVSNSSGLDLELI